MAGLHLRTGTIIDITGVKILGTFVCLENGIFLVCEQKIVLLCDSLANESCVSNAWIVSRYSGFSFRKRE
jgi:hypothetical protein